VVSIQPAGGRWRVEDDRGRTFRPRDLVLGIPIPQALDLLTFEIEQPRELESIRALLGGVGYLSTLTVIAVYPEDSPAPDWQMWYPEESTMLHSISHDSCKRERPTRTALVLQGLPSWSRKWWDRPVGEWSAALVQEAGRLAGKWVTAPETFQTHRWRFARIGGGGELASPPVLVSSGGCRLGLIGDGFHPGGGVQAAWVSGRALAHRFLEETRP
jgi:predicted NAD/FAD-dependent oxidoreductase